MTCGYLINNRCGCKQDLPECTGFCDEYRDIDSFEPLHFEQNNEFWKPYFAASPSCQYIIIKLEKEKEWRKMSLAGDGYIACD